MNDHKELATLVERELDAAGYDVQRGRYIRGNTHQSYELGILPDANDNNFGKPYMVAAIPMIQLDGVPTAPDTTAVQSSGFEPPPAKQLYATFKLRSDEALLFIGQTPPEIDYFSFRSYVFWRFFPEECRKRKLFNSLGDTLNNFRSLGDDPVTSASAVFNANITITSTASPRTQRELQEVLRNAVKTLGQDRKLLEDEVPLDLLHLGVELNRDELMFLVRFGNAEDTDRLDRYSKNEDDSSGLFLRVTPRAPRPVDAGKGFAYSLLPRKTGDRLEAELLPALDALRLAVIQRWATAGYSPTSLQSRVWLYEGIDGIQRGVDYYGENRDTAYFRSEDFVLGPSDVAIVYGVNHQAWGKAVYSNFAAYDAEIFSGVASANSTKPDFGGGAASYLADSKWADFAKYFYVWELHRSGCGSPHSLFVPHAYKLDDEGQRSNRAEIIPLDGPMFCGFRAYVNKATGVGPAWEELLYDRVIKFSANVVGAAPAQETPGS